MSGEQEGMDVVQGKERGTLTLRGDRKVRIYACTLGGSAKVMKMMRKIVKHFGIARLSDIAAMEGKLDEFDVLLNVMEDCHLDLINIAEDVTNMTAQEVSELELDEGIIVLMKIFEVNRDFFMKSLGNVLSLLPTEERKVDQTPTTTAEPEAED